jgi:hypothetical protein
MKIVFYREILTVILFVVVSSNVSFSQSKMIWGKQYGSDKEEYVMNQVVDSRGYIYVPGKTTGSMEGVNAGMNDGFIMKIDGDGNTLWTRQFGSSGDDDVQWSATDESDCIYLTGFTTGNLEGKNYGKEDIFVVKYNSSGDLLWKKQIGTDSTDMGKGIYADGKGFIYVTGVTNGKLGKQLYGKSDGFVIKLDKDGNFLFTYQFGTAGDDFSNSITGAKGYLYVCGETSDDLAAKNKGFLDLFGGKLKDTGELISLFQSGSEGFDIPMDMKVDNDGQIFIAGTTSGNWGCQQIGEGDCFIAAFENSGKLKWINQFGTNSHDGVRSIALSDNLPDRILVSGLIHLPPANAFIKVIGKDGKNISEKQIIEDGKDGDASGKCVNMDNKGNIYHVGLTGYDLFGKLIGGHDFYMVKFKMDSDF